MGYSKITALSMTDLFVQQIENMILSGELAIGEQLPGAGACGEDGRVAHGRDGGAGGA